MMGILGFFCGIIFSIGVAGIVYEVQARREGNYGYKYEEFLPQMYRMREGGMSIRQIATYTGIPKSTVHRYLAAVDRGLKQFSEYEVSEDGSIKKKSK